MRYIGHGVAAITVTVGGGVLVGGDVLVLNETISAVGVLVAVAVIIDPVVDGDGEGVIWDNCGKLPGSFSSLPVVGVALEVADTNGAADELPPFAVSCIRDCRMGGLASHTAAAVATQSSNKMKGAR